MGLDISFPFQAALRAGLETKIAIEVHTPKETIEHLIKVPNVPFWVTADIYNNVREPYELRCMVRANHWGSFYSPLTKLLTENNIQWVES